MLKEGAGDYDSVMAFAAREGHSGGAAGRTVLDIILLILKEDAKNYGWAMANAEGEGHPEIIELLEEWIKN